MGSSWNRTIEELIVDEWVSIFEMYIVNNTTLIAFILGLASCMYKHENLSLADFADAFFKRVEYDNKGIKRRTKRHT